MQNRQAKLHLSVSEILSFAATLPFVSRRTLDGGLSRDDCVIKRGEKGSCQYKRPVENLRPASKIVDHRELQTDGHLEETCKQQNRDSVRQDQTQAEYNQEDKKKADRKRRPNVSSEDHRNNGREANIRTLAIVPSAEDREHNN